MLIIERLTSFEFSFLRNARFAKVHNNENKKTIYQATFVYKTEMGF